MEEVEMFLSPLTARSKVREVLRGLVATRQVHTISMGHAPHFYVAGTLPEFTAAPNLYSGAYLPSSSYFTQTRNHEEEPFESLLSQPAISASSAPVEPRKAPDTHSPRNPVRKPAVAGKSAAARPHFSRPASHSRDRKPATAGKPGQSANGGRPVRRGADARP